MKRTVLVVGLGYAILGITACGGGNAPAPAAVEHGPNDGHGHEAPASVSKCEHGMDAATCEKCKAEGHDHADAVKCEHGMDAAICAECAAEGHSHDTVPAK